MMPQDPPGTIVPLNVPVLDFTRDEPDLSNLSPDDDRRDYAECADVIGCKVVE